MMIGVETMDDIVILTTASFSRNAQANRGVFSDRVSPLLHSVYDAEVRF
jgi:hypothetical protein